MKPTLEELIRLIKLLNEDHRSFIYRIVARLVLEEQEH